MWPFRKSSTPMADAVLAGFKDTVPSKKPDVPSYVLEVIEASLREKAGSDYPQMMHTQTMGSSNSDKFHRQCICKQKRKTESGYEYVIEDTESKDGKYKLIYYAINFQSDKIKVWYGVCNVCKTLYWECNAPYNSSYTRVIKVTE